MRELDVNTQLKNAIEEEKLQNELLKLSVSGRRASYQIDRLGENITHHFLHVTCKTNKVTDVRKERTFQLMNLGHRPATTGTGTRRPRATSGGGGRPASAAVHFIPSTEIEPEARELIYTDPLGRPDIERIHRERADKFYHTKIEKLLDMMKERTNKRRAKSAPSSRVPPTPQYNIANLPQTIPENRQMTRGDAEYEMKKMRATITKQPAMQFMLYGDVKEDTVVRKVYNPDQVGSTVRIRDSHGRTTSAPGGRRMSTSSQERRASTVQERRASTVQERRASTAKDRNISVIQETNTRVSNERRPSTVQDRRWGQVASSHSRSSFKTQGDDSDVSSASSSSSSDFLPSRRQPPPGPPRAPDQAHYNALGLKLNEYQSKKYPSRFLDANPDFHSRQKPYPVLFDKRLQKAFDAFCRSVARVGTISQARACLEDAIARLQLNQQEKLEIWEAGYVNKAAWSKNTTTPRDLRSEDSTRTLDTGPKF